MYENPCHKSTSLQIINTWKNAVMPSQRNKVSSDRSEAARCMKEEAGEGRRSAGEGGRKKQRRLEEEERKEEEAQVDTLAGAAFARY